MNEKQDNRDKDEKALIDFLLGRSDPAEAQALRRRLESDEALRRLHRDLANTFAALDLAPEAEPPEGLVDKTLELVRRQRATDALLAREKPAGRVFAPTFSLRELGALAAAVVVLVLIFVPAIQNARRRAQAGQCGANEGQVGAAMLTFANANKGYLPSAGSEQCDSSVGQIGTGLQAYANASKGYLPSATGEKQRWLAGDNQPAVSNSAALFQLIVGRHASPLSFQCAAVGGGSFVVQAGMTDFPEAKFVSYSYQHSMGPNRLRLNDPRLQQVKERMPILGDDTPMFDNGRFRPDRVNASASDNHRGEGQNVLFLDGHVEWATEAFAGVDRDNIFWAGNIHDYQGTEAPASLFDTFLLPAFSPHGRLP